MGGYAYKLHYELLNGTSVDPKEFLHLEENGYLCGMNGVVEELGC